MPGIIVVGLQWGDEGKGKAIDLLSQTASHVVRSQGGNNAGHTVRTKDRDYIFHLIPSGILHPHTHIYITGGCLIDPKSLIEEIKRIESWGIDLMQRLHISLYAQIIFPFHRELDRLYEERKKNQAIGTTGRGIGPSSSDRASRIGIRIAELVRPEIFKEKLRALLDIKNSELEKIFMQKKIDFEEIFSEYSLYGQLLHPFICNAEERIRTALLRDETVLFEGAHGTLLDCTFGSYPYVTSSSSIASGVCAGAGVGPTLIDEVTGVVKAYTTRVGEGPLPTAVLPDEMEDFHKVEDFREVGATTGRKRRIGWLDLVLVRYAVNLNGVNNLILTKLDILDYFEEIKLCIRYQLDGEEIDIPPPLSEDLLRVQPIYETFSGWQISTREVKSIRQLPQNARTFIDRIEEFCNVPVSMISVGSAREHTIEVDLEWM